MNTEIYTSTRRINISCLFYAFLFLSAVGFSSCNEAPISSNATFDEDSFVATPPSTVSHGKAGRGVVSDAEFKVFDEIRHFGKPDMQHYGFTPIKGIYTSQLWGKRPNEIHRSSVPVQSMLEEQSQLAHETNPDIAMLDIEHWPTYGVPVSTINESVSKLVHTYERFKIHNPGMKFGYYGEVPIRITSSHPKPKKLLEWRTANKHLQPLADKVDVFFLHTKTHFTNRQAWARNMKINIRQARRMAKGKPVYVLLDPQYPQKVTGASSDLHNKYVEADYWRWQLNQARRFADGIMIWSHYGRKWDESAPWWIETQKFLKKMEKY